MVLQMNNLEKVSNKWFSGGYHKASIVKSTGIEKKKNGTQLYLS